MEGMNIGFFINIRKEVDCKDNRFKNEESYVRERRDTNNPAFSSFIHLLFVSRLSHSLLPPVILTRRARFPTGSDRSERQRNECREETKGTGGGRLRPSFCPSFLRSFTRHATRPPGVHLVSPSSLGLAYGSRRS